MNNQKNNSETKKIYVLDGARMDKDSYLRHKDFKSPTKSSIVQSYGNYSGCRGYGINLI